MEERYTKDMLQDMFWTHQALVIFASVKMWKAVYEPSWVSGGSTTLTVVIQVANFCAAMDTLTDQDVYELDDTFNGHRVYHTDSYYTQPSEIHVDQRRGSKYIQNSVSNSATVQFQVCTIPISNTTTQAIWFQPYHARLALRKWIIAICHEFQLTYDWTMVIG